MIQSNEQLFVVTWADFDAGVQRLLPLIPPSCTGIYGVPRGGLVLAVALSHIARLHLVSAPDAATIIVDDIADSGTTLSAWPDHDRLVLVRRFGAKTRAKAAFYLPEGDHRWVLFPWENPDDALREQSDYTTRSGIQSADTSSMKTSASVNEKPVSP